MKLEELNIGYVYHVKSDKYLFNVIGMYECYNQITGYYEFKLLISYEKTWKTDNFHLYKDARTYHIIDLGKKENNLELFI